MTADTSISVYPNIPWGVFMYLAVFLYEKTNKKKRTFVDI